MALGIDCKSEGAQTATGTTIGTTARIAMGTNGDFEAEGQLVTARVRHKPR